MHGRDAHATARLPPIRVRLSLRALGPAGFLLAGVARRLRRTGHLAPPSFGVIPNSSSETWGSLSLSPGPEGLLGVRARTAFWSRPPSLPGWRLEAVASGEVFDETGTTTDVLVDAARFGSPDPASALRSCTAALRPSSVLSYF